MLGRLLLTLACGRLLFFIVASCAALELVARGPDDPVNQTLTFVKLGTGGVPELYPASTPRGSSMEVAVQSTATGCCTKSIIFSLTPFVCLVVTGIAGIDETPSVVSYFSAGTCTLRADQKGKKDKYNPAFKIQSIDVTSPPQPQTISFSTSAPVGAVVFSVYNVVVSATSNLAVTLSVSGPCSVSGNAVTHTGVGSCIVTANQAGNAAWLAAPAVQQTYSISKASQTISITSGPTSVAVGTSYTITAVATSLLPVTFTSSTTGVCTVASSTVTLASTGTCTLRADQAGDANYSPAPQATQSFTVGAAPQAISITSTAPTSPVVGQTYTPTATTNASLTVSFVSATLSVCSISGNIVTFDAVGVCTINFVQNGNGAFGPAPVLNQSMTVGPATQTLTITSTAVSPRVGGTYTVTTILSPNAALPVTFSTTTPTSCVVSGAVVTFSAVAQCTIVASQAGTANLQPVSTSQSVTPAKGTQTVSFVSAPPALLRIGTSYVSAATSTSNLPVDISVSAASAAVCTKDSGSTILLIGIGTCVLLADQPGDANWQPAAQGTQSLVVASLSAFSSPSQLAACTSVSACEGNLTGLTETFAAIEGGLVAQSSACLQPNCSSTPDLPWLTPCTQSYVSCVLNVTGQRVANLGNMLATLNTYSCNTSQCTASLGSARQRTTDQQQSLAFVCLTAQCQTVNSAAVSAQRVSSGAVNAVADEMLRFDRDLDRELLGRLYLDTWNYYQCSDGGCRDRYYALINESYAVQGYVVASEREGMEASNVSVVRSILDRLDAAYRPCALGPCDGVVFSTTRSTKRAHYTHLLQWGSRLSALLANCSGACDRAALAAASSSNDRSTFVASNYLPSEVSVAGIVIYSVIAAACIAVAVMAVVWQAFYGKMLFGLVLLAIFLAAVFRIRFVECRARLCVLFLRLSLLPASLRQLSSRGLCRCST